MSILQTGGKLLPRFTDERHLSVGREKEQGQHQGLEITKQNGEKINTFSGIPKTKTAMQGAEGE